MAATEWDDAVVHSISTAPISAADDQRQRVRSYLISMSIRTVSFAFGFLFGFVLDVQWAAWGFMIAAVVLPYPAVVLANNRDRHLTTPSIVSPLKAIGETAWPTDEHEPDAGYPRPGQTSTHAPAAQRGALTPHDPTAVDARDHIPGHEPQRPLRRNWMSG